MEIVLASNTYRRFSECVDMAKSAFNGSRKPDECLIWDNSSGLFVRYLEDNNIDPVSDLSNSKIAISPMNLGCSRAWNAIMKLIQNHFPNAYVLIVNDDIQFHHNTLELFEKAVLEHPNEIIYVCGGIASPNAFSAFMVHPATFIEKVGLFDDNFKMPYCEDADKYRDIRLAGYDLYRIPDCTVDHLGSATIATYDETEMQQHHMHHARNMEYLMLKWDLSDHNLIELEYDGVQNGYRVPFDGDEDNKAMVMSYLRSKYGY